MNENKEITRPEFKWAYYLFWTKPARFYRRELERYEDQFLLKSEKVRKKQYKMIDGINAFIFIALSTCWTILPSLVDLPHWLKWSKLGMYDVSWQHNWAGGLVMFVIPASAGRIIQKSPYWFPQKRVQYILNWTLKLLPILILILTTYWFKTQREYREFIRYEKEQFKKELNKE